MNDGLSVALAICSTRVPEIIVLVKNGLGPNNERVAFVDCSVAFNELGLGVSRVVGCSILFSLATVKVLAS